MSDDVKALADDLRAAMRASPIDEDDTMLLVEPELLEAAADAIEALSVRERVLVEALTFAEQMLVEANEAKSDFDVRRAALLCREAIALTQSPSTGEVE